MAKWQMPPVIRPISGSSLETLVPSPGHLESTYDDLLFTMVTASFLNLLLYPVENFYVPTLLSLQCAVIQSQLKLTGQLNCAQLLARHDMQGGGASPPALKAGDEGGTPPGSPRLRADLETRSPRSPSKQPPILPLSSLTALDFDAQLSYRHYKGGDSGRSARPVFAGRGRGGGGFASLSNISEPPRSPGGNRRRRPPYEGWNVRSPRVADLKKAESSPGPRSPNSVDSAGATDSLPLLLNLEPETAEDVFASPTAAGDEAAGLKAILDIFKPEEILHMMTLIQQGSGSGGQSTEPPTPGLDSLPSPSHHARTPSSSSAAVIEPSETSHWAAPPISEETPFTPQGTPHFSPRDAKRGPEKTTL
eukprot:Blabericola_migrator_1__4052@NODE_2234_length_3076_cov_265_485876_g929_i4_p1_GENE_NODE_2234_length_3076_cov_265_485876_g929_i4NODE_2234_length_3076_cov_265_485876_g929_i4_p1_ORF_typecomplete_len363_score50_27_NODE_2234_length_3076_cov_265_485876_g929_i43161404